MITYKKVIANRHINEIPVDSHCHFTNRASENFTDSQAFIKFPD